MTTTTSATATPTPTPTPTATSLVKSATQSLLTSLDTGSGVDTANLVDSLVQAQFATRSAQLTAKTDALTSQISGVSTMKNTISTFSSALQSLIKGGTLQSQPLSSDTKSLIASPVAGAKMANVSSTINVTQLASAQSARTKTAVSDRSAVIGSGTLTLNFGAATYDSTGTKMTGFTAPTGAVATTIELTNATLDDVATAINAKKVGVTATVISDGNGGAYLSLKGQSGTNSAFTLTSGDAAFQQFEVKPVSDPDTSTTAISGKAANAQLTVDGISVERSSNTITDLLSGVKLQLNAVSTGPVSLTSERPTTAITQAVQDVVDTYNQVLTTLKEQTDPITGPLRGDQAAQSLLRSLRGLTLATVSDGTGSAPKTLAEIGVSTNKDGTLKLDTKVLDAAMKANPDAIESMFASTTTGLAKVLSTISDAATNTVYGLGASEARYTSAKTALGKDQTKITEASDAMRTRLTQQYAAMNSRVAAYKKTQTFLEGQIKAWNKSDN